MIDWLVRLVDALTTALLIGFAVAVVVETSRWLWRVMRDVVARRNEP